MGLGNLGRKIVDSFRAGGGTPPPRTPRSPGFEPMPLRDPEIMGEVPSENAFISTRSQEWREDSGWTEQQEADSQLSPFANWAADNAAIQMASGNSTFTKLRKSSSATANWMAGTVLESSNGFGRGQATAAIRNDIYQGRILQPLAHESKIMNVWAKEQSLTMGGTGFFTSKEGRAAFNRQVMLERNRRNLGLPDDGNVNPRISQTADLYDMSADRAHKVGTGREGQHAVDGFENVAENKHYTPYSWNGKQLQVLVKNGITDVKKLTSALSKSYKEAGINGKDTDAIANAVITRAMRGGADVDTSVYGLLNAEGQEWLKEVLSESLSEVEAEGVISRLVGDKAERSKEGFAKTRNDVNMATHVETLDGSELQIVDLLDNDQQNVWQKYARRMSGAGALARQGITNKRDREAVAATIRQEQRMMGEEPTPVEEIMAMFSHFDGGGIKGWSKLGGGDPATQSAVVSTLKRATNLAWLGKMGFTQLGETGAAIAAMGVANFYKRGLEPIFSKTSKEAKDTLIMEMGFITGQIGLDHKIFADHLALDEIAEVDAKWFAKTNQFLSKGTEIQSYLSLFNKVRSWQQTTAATGVADKVMRDIKAGKVDDAWMARAWQDLGLKPENVESLRKLIDEGTIEFSPEGHVNRLNADQWDYELQDAVGAGFMRNISQIVQKSHAGEQSPWMHTDVGSLLTHLKTFPMGAVNKQFIRNSRRGFIQPEFGATLIFGLATSATALLLRDMMAGKETEINQEFFMRAVNYSNMTGWVGTYFDPVMSMLGLEDSTYMDAGSVIDPASFSWANDAVKLPGAIGAAAAGKANYGDRKAFKATPGANLSIWGQFLGGVGDSSGEGNFTTRNRPKVQRAREEAAAAEEAPVTETVTEQTPLGKQLDLMLELNK